jgi:hypothetical protein
MPKYHVTYFYLATGMEGIPDMKCFGIVEADSKRKAKESVIDQYGFKDRDWYMSCLSADEVKNV